MILIGQVVNLIHILGQSSFGCNSGFNRRTSILIVFSNKGARLIEN
jgi:hypothetical protein